LKHIINISIFEVSLDVIEFLYFLFYIFQILPNNYSLFCNKKNKSSEEDYILPFCPKPFYLLHKSIIYEKAKNNICLIITTDTKTYDIFLQKQIIDILVYYIQLKILFKMMKPFKSIISSCKWTLRSKEVNLLETCPSINRQIDTVN